MGFLDMQVDKVTDMVVDKVADMVVKVPNEDFTDMTVIFMEIILQVVRGVGGGGQNRLYWWMKLPIEDLTDVTLAIEMMLECFGHGG